MEARDVMLLRPQHASPAKTVNDVLRLTILLERCRNSNGFEVLFLGNDPTIIDYQEGSGSS
jgi:hypothetical protein